MKRNFLPLLMLAALLISACKKTSTNNGTTAEPIYLLSTAASGDGSQAMTYKYDSKNRLVEIITTGLSAADLVYTYDDNDRVIKTVKTNTANAIETKTFTYSGQTVNISWNDISGVKGAITNSTITLDNKGRVSTVLYGTLTQYNYDNNGNVESLQFYSDATGTKLGSTITWVYDNKKFPFINVKGNYYLYDLQPGAPIVNNKLSGVNTTYATNGNSVINYSFVDQYNDAGYPVSVISSYVVNSTTSGQSTFNYTYIVK